MPADNGQASVAGQVTGPQTVTTPDQEPEFVDLPADADPLAGAPDISAAVAAGGDPAAKPDDRPRDANGRFLPKASEAAPDTTAVASSTDTPASQIAEAYIEAARQEGFSNEQIARLTDNEDAKAQIAFKRQQNLARYIDPNEWQQYQQWRQGAVQPPPPTQAPPTVPVPEEVKLDIDENSLDPEVAKVLKTMMANQNALRAAVLKGEQEKQQLVQQMTEAQQREAQSAQTRQETERAERAAVEWDRAAAQVPGFMEHFGSMSELMALQRKSPGDDKVVDFEAFRAYFAREAQPWLETFGRIPESKLATVIEKVFRKSPFGRNGTTNGNANGNGKHTFGPGSMPRGSQRRATEATVATDDSDWDAEMKRISGVVEEAWSQAGGNPFRS